MSWQSALQSGFKTPETLLQYLQIETSVGSAKAHQSFKTRVPLSYAKRMRKGDKSCPLLKQVLPLDVECIETTDFVLDPLQEKKQNPTPGILHKYHGRVLVMLAVSCAVNCRYCFRRHFPYQDNQVSQKEWDAIFEYLRTHPDVHEVILSGGDPLMLPTMQLARFLQQLETIKTVKTVRFHTRLPVVIPSRLDEAFMSLMADTRLNKVMVLHINHVNELCDELSKGVALLRSHQVSVLNQSVLLKGVNDSADSLICLSHGLFDAGILPYYLHMLDRVKGTRHFEVDERRALSLYDAMQKALPGYLVPKLVRELPTVGHKVLIK